MAGKYELDPCFGESCGILGRQLPMHQFFEFCIDRGFEGCDIGGLWKIDREDDGSAGTGNRIEQLVFLTGPTQDGFEPKLFGEGICAE